MRDRTCPSKIRSKAQNSLEVSVQDTGNRSCTSSLRRRPICRKNFIKNFVEQRRRRWSTVQVTTCQSASIPTRVERVSVDVLFAMGWWLTHVFAEVWTPEEDELLRGLIEKNGTGNCKITPITCIACLICMTVGSVIAKHLPHRKGKQCRERWFNHLDPNIKKGDWTPEVCGIEAL